MAMIEASGVECVAASRRQYLKLCLAGALGCPLLRGSTRFAATADETPKDDAAVDHVWQLLHDREPHSKQGLSTHAPMVVETLSALGLGDQAEAWVERYRAPVVEIPSPSKRIDAPEWRAALGPRWDAPTWEASLARWGDWKVWFLEELENAPWRDVLDRWVARLAPGLCAAATHGVIRTAHAARALGRRETRVRKGELARGLAYWAAAYQELPCAQLPVAGEASYAVALDRVPLYSAHHNTAPTGNIVSGLRTVGGLAGFDQVRDLAAVPADVGSALSQLSATFARVYLQHGTRHHTIAFVHAVTGPCALRRITPHVRPETALAALPYAWQAAAAIFAAYARRDEAATWRDAKLGREDLVGRAVENGDEHAIKFTEVLLSEHSLSAEPVYLAAAEDAVTRLGR